MDLEQIRAQAQAIVERAKRNPEFLEQLRSNPRETLSTAGLAEDAVSDFLRAAGMGSEVEGYLSTAFCYLTDAPGCGGGEETAYCEATAYGCCDLSFAQTLLCGGGTGALTAINC